MLNTVLYFTVGCLGFELVSVITVIARARLLTVRYIICVVTSCSQQEGDVETSHVTHASSESV